MTKIQKFVWVIRNWNFDIIWDLVFGDWCFSGGVINITICTILFMWD